MEEKYDWSIILKVSAPVSIIVGYIFYSSQNNFLKWITIIIGAISAGAITYAYDKRKSSVFTSSAFVVLVAVLVTLFNKLKSL